MGSFPFKIMNDLQMPPIIISIQHDIGPSQFNKTRQSLKAQVWEGVNETLTSDVIMIYQSVNPKEPTDTKNNGALLQISWIYKCQLPF